MLYFVETQVSFYWHSYIGIDEFFLKCVLFRTSTLKLLKIIVLKNVIKDKDGSVQTTIIWTSW
jgi:hypothetical protein